MGRMMPMNRLRETESTAKAAPMRTIPTTTPAHTSAAAATGGTRRPRDPVRNARNEG
jgi:hypothetical protein